MPKMAFVLICILMLSVLGRGTYGFYDAELQQNPNFNFRQESDIIKFSPITVDNPVKRYIIFGSGSISPVKSRADNLIYGTSSTNGFFSVGLFSEKGISDLKQKGYTVIEDFMLQFDSMEKTSKTEGVAEGSRIGNIVGSEEVFQKYNLTGKGVTIGIVDTGADFSNPDMMDSLARDKNNIPIMIDTDGQGLVLTNSTFIANINENGIIKNYTKIIPKNITSSVYVNSKGVYLDLSKKGVGTPVLVYNSLLQGTGNPVLNGTISNDMKIGKTNRDFIISKSGIYHLGVIYQGYSQGPLARVQLVPVLVVDSKVAGMYNTIIPDMSTSWLDFNRFEQRSLTSPKYDFDFTDETPITLGNGKEFLVYDSNKDGKFDYSAGTVGAQVVDIYGVMGKQSSIDVKLKAVNGTLLQPLDPKGNYFGVMYDFLGHGTSSAATIISKGVGSYDLYSNSTKYSLRGIAPGAKIIPIKSLWLGDAVYGWLWAAGFSQKNNTWIFEGKPRVDIISNSWGVPNFPTLQAAPGLDVLSLVVSALAVPGSIDKNYPGTLFVTSAGNSGHGYGTIGIPAAVPYGLTVGATTNNVYVGTGQFKNQPRFGNSTAFSNNIADFSSRGPGLIGNPEPDLMGVGAYSFTPTSVTRTGKNMTDPFVMFGGTSMAAPIVSGSAAILIESLKQKGTVYDPFRIKNILMSTATDLKNDPFSQGAGLVNVAKAVDFVKGKSGVFVVHNNVSYSNIKKVLDIPINSINSSSFGVQKLQLPDYAFPETAWFAGRLDPGERTSATFTIENPTNDTLDIKIAPQNFEQIEKLQYTGTTQVGQQDKLINKSGVYRPNYILLEDMIERKDLRSFFQKVKPIPDDASMMILNLNFPFSNFMNSTEKLYANDIRISSLYFYDWNDKNKDGNVTSNELSMVNRGGSWGTVQEIRVSEPNSEIKNTPLVGVYPVPTRYSYWTGDTKKNSTSMDYTLTASFYKKKGWTDVWINSNSIQVLPHSSSDVTATLVVPIDSKPGVYQGFISFKSDKHEVNAPISFAVKKKIQGKDMPTVIEGSKDVDVLYGNGYIGGAFDMVNRYNAGDWRQYYFDVQDSTINTAALNISWQNKDTNLAVFVIDPLGKIVQTNVPPGVLGQFQGWPTGDWLGTTPFSEGGGFFPIKNKDATSTVLYAPINQTGTYSILMHSTLFGGQDIAEPITVTAKFSTILPDEKAPQILLSAPGFINGTSDIKAKIIDENLDTAKYYLDDNESHNINGTEFSIPHQLLEDGMHRLNVIATDTVGHKTEENFTLTVDRTPPEIIIKSPQNGTTISKTITIDLDIKEQNLLETGGITITLPHEIVLDKKSAKFDTETLENGKYDIHISAKDKAGNEASKKITINVDNRPNLVSSRESPDQNSVLIQGIVIGIAIATAAILIIIKKIKISKKN